jgi:peptidyl-tRNA hydrolase, PTH1 family
MGTLHSAGHTAIGALAQELQYCQFQKSRTYGNGLLASSSNKDDSITLWQSPSLMNISGKALSKAWKAYLSELDPSEREDAKLVVLHDELEIAPGKLKIKVGGSARGHNGLKSIIECLPGQTFTRIGVGIGRPVSREPGDVAAYVLRKMTGDEKRKVEGSVPQILNALRSLP